MVQLSTRGSPVLLPRSSSGKPGSAAARSRPRCLGVLPHAYLSAPQQLPITILCYSGFCGLLPVVQNQMPERFHELRVA